MYRYNEFEKLEHLEKECPYCHGAILEVAVKCRNCGEFIEDFKDSVAIPFDTPNYTQRENYFRKPVSVITKFLGLVLIVFGFVGFATIYWPIILFSIGIFFLMIGALGTRWQKCSNCGCAIANKDISKCPRCYFEFVALND